MLLISLGYKTRSFEVQYAKKIVIGYIVCGYWCRVKFQIKVLLSKSIIHIIMFKCFSDMESWKKVSYTVCVFMFLSHTCPLNPYITAYLTGPNGNISLSEVIIICVFFF